MNSSFVDNGEPASLLRITNIEQAKLLRSGVYVMNGWEDTVVRQIFFAQDGTPYLLASDNSSSNIDPDYCELFAYSLKR